MKKLIIVGLLAISSLAATAATVKTSKATPLSTSQMESIKGEGLIRSYVWTLIYSDPYNPFINIYDYVLVSSGDTGPYGPSLDIFNGGPLNGQIIHH